MEETLTSLRRVTEEIRELGAQNERLRQEIAELQRRLAAGTAPAAT
jgi:prefoldin subunit 5